MNTAFECHGHLMMDGKDFAEARRRHGNGVDTGALRASLAALNTAGIRFFRDGGDAYGVSAAGRDIAPEYGIKVITPVFAIHKLGLYGSIVGRSYDDMHSFRRRVAELKEAKGDFIKLMLSGIITFRYWGSLSCEGVRPDEIKELVNIAHGEGLSVMVHANGAQTIRAAAEAGADSVEHGYFADRAALDAMAENRVIWVPTLAAVEAFIGREGIDLAVAERTLDEQLHCLSKAREMRITVAAGSDSGAVGVPHGQGTVREHYLLIRAGFTEEEVSEANERLWKRFCGNCE
ncbi:MAG: amidohydrolase family protein [Oscillospiraceae bacterium]|nr:amidohydrolase family protein [Oscillospiraceae bacterium]